MTVACAGIAGDVVRWQRSHGRHALPWQNTRDPYRVWLSEIMLQQTQVAVVLGYYERFLAHFPDVHTLSAAPLDEVLGLWSGLGYYSRARNLHSCAQVVVDLHDGKFPETSEGLRQLPGIGRSTAAAIAAFCFDERTAILDGNVKRVLTRVLAFEADLANSANEKVLWDLANQLVPATRTDMPAYTQGLMDLGATVCLARKPSCLLCPLQAICGASAQGAPERFPVRNRRLKRTSQSLWLLHARADDGAVWLEKRPTPGVWAGLYCLPLFESREALAQALPARTRQSASDVTPFVHVLTHKDLHLHPVRAVVTRRTLQSRDGGWFTPQQWTTLGLPAPVRKLLST
ncbi:MAG: A/G-specific adenine glycosylase [Ramlibacter sp.]